MSFSLADISQFESLMSSPPQECIPVHNVDMSLSTVASISGIPSIVSVCEILSKAGMLDAVDRYLYGRRARTIRELEDFLSRAASNITSATTQQNTPKQAAKKKPAARNAEYDKDQESRELAAMAASGNPEAQKLLGDKLEAEYQENNPDGYERSQHDNEALFWYKQAAEAGNAEAQYIMGELGYKEEDEKSALEWLTRAAKQGHPSAQLRLGYMYGYGIGTDKNPKLALDWLEQAEKQNNIMAKQLLQKLYPDRKEPAQEIPKKEVGIVVPGAGYQRVKRTLTEDEKIHQADLARANNGDPYAQIQVARAYEIGHRTKQDKEKADMWYRRSTNTFRDQAMEGNANGMFQLAQALAMGHGTPKNMEMALFWMRKAGQHGIKVADEIADEWEKT